MITLSVSPAMALAAASDAPDPSPLACPFVAGQTIEETRPALPRGSDIPIDHVVFVMQENRSFDHIFQTLPAYGQADVDVAAPGASNRDRHGVVRPISRATSPCTDGPPHSWNSVHEQIDGGRMDGFAASGGGNAMIHYDAEWLPFYHSLANTFAIADRHFSSVPGPTWPNRMFALSGTSFGHIRNKAPPPRDEDTSIFHQLEAAGLPWGVFGASEPTFEEQIFPALRKEHGQHFRDVDAFHAAAAAGDLPSFAWVTSAGGHNEHPPKSVQAGQAFVADIVASVMNGPDWPRTALFFTYDEHGGFYDHVPPPPACPPDAIAARREASDLEAGFDRLGPRVPLIVVSPWARAHHVSHVVHDHTSVIRFVQARFGLEALSARDANAEPPMEMFDFSHPAFATPPALAEAVVDPAFDGHCADTRTTDYDDEPATAR